MYVDIILCEYCVSLMLRYVIILEGIVYVCACIESRSLMLSYVIIREGSTSRDCVSI